MVAPCCGLWTSRHRAPRSAVTPPSVLHQQRPDCRSFYYYACLTGRAFGTLHWGVQLTARESQGPPEPGELVPAALTFRERHFCVDRGSLIEADPAKPACAQFWKHPQALTCLSLSLFRMFQEERIPSGCHVLGFCWQKALWGCPRQGGKSGEVPRGICCARNKPVRPCSIANWKWLVLTSFLGIAKITFLRLGNVWFPLQHPGEEGTLS